jgi:ribosomal protein S18 acetylase RimI-like enzyme
MMPSGDQRRFSYFKRFKMEIDLNSLPAVPPLPPGYAWVPWDDYLVEQHAAVLFACFCEEIDATVFPSLGSRDGCGYLMSEICRKPGFLPGATWLLKCEAGCCGTVQGVRERNGMGAIQNLGIVPGFRSFGLGSALLLRALHGFYAAGLGRAFLEVTAQNDGAVRLYHRLGFRRRKTVYKTVDNAVLL